MLPRDYAVVVQLLTLCIAVCGAGSGHCFKWLRLERISMLRMRRQVLHSEQTVMQVCRVKAAMLVKDVLVCCSDSECVECTCACGAAQCACAQELAVRRAVISESTDSDGSEFQRLILVQLNLKLVASRSTTPHL